ncbi:uncharacterized protein LOC111941570 [Cyanistes caeruleus]|uniref:uncharacterized protein LOC111941570 n=1 Tax=Cyanistes caeruleus TaxID=156563 RepID=UPI000CDB9B98|nr:uncharacterized protein LOC111941570 [Cyanistes caeruleus]
MRQKDSQDSYYENKFSVAFRDSESNLLASKRMLQKLLQIECVINAIRWTADLNFSPQNCRIVGAGTDFWRCSSPGRAQLGLPWLHTGTLQALPGQLFQASAPPWTQVLPPAGLPLAALYFILGSARQSPAPSSGSPRRCLCGSTGSPPGLPFSGLAGPGSRSLWSCCRAQMLCAASPGPWAAAPGLCWPLFYYRQRSSVGFFNGSVVPLLPTGGIPECASKLKIRLGQRTVQFSSGNVSPWHNSNCCNLGNPSVQRIHQCAVMNLLDTILFSEK